MVKLIIVFESVDGKQFTTEVKNKKTLIKMLSSRQFFTEIKNLYVEKA